MNKELDVKREALYREVRKLGSCVIAFSGGTDSALLLAVAKEVLGDRTLAVTATSAIYPARERDEARELAQRIGVRHQVIASRELELPAFVENTKSRCYYCKSELFSRLRAIAQAEGLTHLIDGANRDDRSDYRPGSQAASEQGVVSPLELAGLTKEDVRALSRKMELPTWEKPAYACLASRIPYGTSVTRERLRQIETAEEELRGLGFRILRVRHHDTVARIELGEAEFAQAAGPLRDEVIRIVKAAGYAYVALDLQGYRTGAMNETLIGGGASRV
jgi:uncharacterized protein